MKIHISGKLLIISRHSKTSSCFQSKIVLTKKGIIGFQTDYEDQTMKIILDGAEPVWLYFQDSSVSDDALEAATAKLETFLADA
jgi:hypothetical protein